MDVVIYSKSGEEPTSNNRLNVYEVFGKDNEVNNSEAKSKKRIVVSNVAIRNLKSIQIECLETFETLKKKCKRQGLIFNYVIPGKKRKGNFAEMIPVGSKVQKQMVEGRKIDMYCWICHKQGQEILCNSCPRVFHENCINRSKCKFSDSGRCFECHSPSLIKDVQVQPIKYQRLRSLLKFVLLEALKDEVSEEENNLPRNESHCSNTSRFLNYFMTWIPHPNDKFCNIMDVAILIDKINDIFPYLSCAAFFSDVKWIYHNSYIEYGADSVVTEYALKLEKIIEQELLDIEGCPECYYLKHSEEYKNINSFLKVCQNAHEVVWAKLRGFPYWPAKLLRIYNGQCDVRFFADHNKSVIPIRHCFKISEQSPNNREIKQRKYKEACKEMSSYLTNYREIVADFAYSSRCIPLNSNIKGKKPKRDHCRRKAISEADVPEDPELIEASKSNKMPCTSNCISPNSMDIPINENYSINCSKKDQACMDFVADDDVVVPSESSRVVDPPTSSAFNHLIFTPASTSHKLVSSAATNIPMASTSNKAINSNEVHPFVNTKTSIKLPVIPSAIFSAVLHDNVASNTVNEIMQSLAFKYSLCDLISRNNPYLQKFLKETLDMGITLFHKFYMSQVLDKNIETVHDKHNEIVWRSYVILFQEFSEATNKLKERATFLLDASKKLIAENESLKKKHQSIKEKCNILMVRQNSSRKMINYLRGKFNASTCCREYEDEIKLQELEENVQNLTVALGHRNYLLNQLNGQHELDLKRIEHLENVLTSYEKTYSAVSVQTLPNNQEFV